MCDTNSKEEKITLKIQPEMKVDDLMYISMNKLKDACNLLEKRRYEGACYIGGYTIECILKFIILKELGLMYYDKTSFRNLKTNYNKLKNLKTKEDFFKNNKNLIISNEIQAFMNIINNTKDGLICEIDISKIEKEIEKTQYSVLNFLNYINKTEETINDTNRKNLNSFNLKFFNNTYTPKEYEDLEEYVNKVSKIYDDILCKHDTKKAIDKLNVERISDINLNRYKILFLWWEQWRYRLYHGDVKIDNINSKEFCKDFIKNIINFLEELVEKKLIKEILHREYIKKEIKEAEKCIQNFAQ